MILRQGPRLLYQFSTCCQGHVHATCTSRDYRNHVHTSSSLLASRDPRKQWEEFTKNVKKKGSVREWLKEKAEEQQQKNEQTYRQAKQGFQEKREERRRDSDTHGGVEGDIPGKIMEMFPTTAKFNSVFDRAFSKLPDGAELIRKLPAEYRPYLYLSRMDKPIGSWLLFLPGAWGICMAPGFISFPLLLKFGLGAIAMRGAGCTINDIYDIDIDKRVIRTRNRPLASGALTTKQAINWFAIQLGFSALILFSLNTQTIVLGMASLLLVGTYPLMKRVTDFPQLYLGITFNLGALMGYSAAAGDLGFAPFSLYAAGICWTMVYDTIYAHQDKVDDRRVGVRSTALRWGDKTVQICTNFTTAMGLALFMSGMNAGLGPSFYLASFLSTCMILRGLTLVDLDSPKSCWEFFLMNRNIGIIILLSIILGKVF